MPKRDFSHLAILTGTMRGDLLKGAGAAVELAVGCLMRVLDDKDAVVQSELKNAARYIRWAQVMEREAAKYD